MIQRRLIQGFGVSPVISASLVWSSTKTDQICFTFVSVSLSAKCPDVKNIRGPLFPVCTLMCFLLFSVWLMLKEKAQCHHDYQRFRVKKQKKQNNVSCSSVSWAAPLLEYLRGFFFYVSSSVLSSYRLRPWLAVDLNMEMKIWNRGEGVCCWSHMWHSSSHKKNPTQVPSGSNSQSAQIRPKGVCRNSAAALY